jgi:hypothetical protein
MLTTQQLGQLWRFLCTGRYFPGHAGGLLYRVVNHSQHDSLSEEGLPVSALFLQEL